MSIPVDLELLLFGTQLFLACDLHDSFQREILRDINSMKLLDSLMHQQSLSICSIWLQARPLFRDRRKFSQMADPMLQGQYPVRGLYQALAVAAMCVQEQPSMRPLIADVVTALAYLASQTYNPKNQQNQHTSRLPAPGTPPQTRLDIEKKPSGGSERDRLRGLK